MLFKICSKVDCMIVKVRFWYFREQNTIKYKCFYLWFFFVKSTFIDTILIFVLSAQWPLHFNRKVCITPFQCEHFRCCAGCEDNIWNAGSLCANKNNSIDALTAISIKYFQCIGLCKLSKTFYNSSHSRPCFLKSPISKYVLLFLKHSSCHNKYNISPESKWLPLTELKFSCYLRPIWSQKLCSAVHF